VSTIPMLDLRREYEWMKAEIDEAIGRCLTHQQWILGPEVREFEAKAAEYLGVEHCIGVSSGTEALVLGLRALAIKTKGREYFEREDEVVTTPFTFVATGDAILRAGATPVFVDIDPATFNLSTDALSDCLARGGGHVVGVLPVHLFGGACDMAVSAHLVRSVSFRQRTSAASVMAACARRRTANWPSSSGCS
jgi:UDP-2-acetamido-2-deoxy-ribo-hexuluronate aminotransferase